jgi:hypothetical protein
MKKKYAAYCCLPGEDFNAEIYVVVFIHKHFIELPECLNWPYLPLSHESK